jgi:hypothetical protein
MAMIVVPQAIALLLEVHRYSQHLTVVQKGRTDKQKKKATIELKI